MKNSQVGAEKLGKTAEFSDFPNFFHFNAPRLHVFEYFYKPLTALNQALQDGSFDTHIDIF